MSPSTPSLPDPWWTHSWNQTGFLIAIAVVAVVVLYVMRARLARAESNELPTADPPKFLDSLPPTQADALGSVCAALGLGPEWSADPATPIGVLLKETPVTLPELRDRLRSLYSRDIGAVDEATTIGTIAGAITLSA